MAIKQPVTVREPYFFSDPMTDRLVGAVMALTSEVHALRERTRTLEDLLVGKAVLAVGDVEQFEPDSTQRTAREVELRALVARVMSELARGEQPQSRVDERVIDIARLSNELDLPITAVSESIGVAAPQPSVDAGVGRHA